MGKNEKIPRFLNVDGTKNSGPAKKLRQLLRYSRNSKERKIKPEIIYTLNDVIENFIVKELGVNVKWEKIPPHAIFIDSRYSFCRENAFYIANKQRIGIHESYINSRELPAIIKVLLHEMIHLSSTHMLRRRHPFFKRLAIQSQKLNRKGEILRFGEGFDEALTEEIAKYIWYLRFDNSNEEQKHIKQAIYSHEDFRPHLIDPYDILYIKLNETGGFSKKDPIVFAYIEQRRVLRYVAEKILEHNPKYFSNLKDVYFMLFRMKYKPDIKEEAKLIDSALGARAFRILMRMGTRPESAKQTFDALRELYTKSKLK